MSIMNSKNKEDQARRERETLDSVRAVLNGQDLNCFYGFTQDDVDKLLAAFQGLQQNDQTTFPDFYSDSSCVELFSISSSEESKRGGSSQMMQDGQLRAEVERNDALASMEMQPTARTYQRLHPTHSYADLTRSLRSHCVQHLKSLEKCEKSFDTSVFIIECRELDLHCAFAATESIDCDGIRVGDLFPIYEGNKPYGLYRLSRDRENLLWLQSQLGVVDFIIFVGSDHIEAINPHRADVIVAYLPWRLVTAQALTITSITSIPVFCAAKEFE